MNRKCFLLLFSLSIISCTSTEPNSTPNITFAPLKSAYNNYHSEKIKPRPSLAFNDTTRVTNCTDYLSAQKTSQIMETGANFLVAQEYLICDTLNAIEQASTTNDTRITKNTTFDGGKQLANRIDLRTFRSSFYQRVDDAQYTLATMPNVTTEKYAAISDDNDWFYELRIIARLDLNDNGKEDWLIWLTDKAKTGSYNTLSGLVAYDVTDDRTVIHLAPLVQ